MRLLLLPFHASGHLNPALAVASEWVSRGHEVLCLTSGNFAEQVRGTGADFLEVDPGFAAPEGGRPPDDLVMTLLRGVPGMIERMVPGLRARLAGEHFDAILYDPMCFWGRALASVLPAPSVALQTSFVGAPGSKEAREAAPAIQLNPRTLFELARFSWSMQRLHRRHGIARLTLPTLFSPAELLNIVPVPRAFAWGPPTTDPRYVFTGPCLAPRHDAGEFPLERLDRGHTLLVTCGTVVTQNAAFYRDCIAAFEGTDWTVVMAIGNRVRLEELGRVPSHFIVRPRIPQLAVLERARVFITHGGMNSAMEGLAAGVPLVVVPRTSEQRATARRLKGLGLGALLEPAEATPERLRAAVAEADGADIRRAVGAFAPRVTEGGGAAGAVDALLAHVAARGNRRAA